jgi:hypothetical protein
MELGGMGMMLRACGIDPDEMKQQAEQFMIFMKQGVEKINANQERIESALKSISAAQERSAERINAELAIISSLLLLQQQEREGTTSVVRDENGGHTGVLITSEKFPQAMIDDVNGTTPAQASKPQSEPYPEANRMY